LFYYFIILLFYKNGRQSMRRLVVYCVVLAAFDASAKDLTFSGTAAKECDIQISSQGTLNIEGTTVATGTSAEIVVTNNSANTFTLNIVDPGDFTTKPSGYTGTATLDAKMTLTGVNTDSSVNSKSLSSVGRDTVSIDITGTTSDPVIAGDYTAVAVVSCDG
jgi:pectate lyase